MTEVIGKCGIGAKIVLDSISAVTGSRLTTMEITYPRFILAEFNTHRMLSRSSASSRAIPFAKMQENLTAIPVRFGQANKGMQDKGEEHDRPVYFHTYETYGDGDDIVHVPCQALGSAQDVWETAKDSSEGFAKAFYDAGYHKQVYNRLTEPFQMMKTVVSATEWSNFFWLRDDEAADPSIAELARCMKQAYEQSEPRLLQVDEWHLPYVDFIYNFDIETGDGSAEFSQSFYVNDEEVSLEDAIKVSCARACAVSFRNVDYGLEKSKEVYKRLISDSKIHGSALEHAAKVMKQTREDYSHGYDCETYLVNIPDYPKSWEEGISHADRSGNLWSGNFKGFVQHRKTIKGENYESK